MRAAATVVTALVIGIAVVWLLAKMSRTDAADMRLIYLGLAFAAGLLAVLAGMARMRGRRRDRS